ncbi:MAG TPA: methyltransferase domain-containing protein [Vicinamibacterales bacterium]|jgi:ubiquinone/menaquinone biosynthesis C-methylase UbiE
MIATLPPRRTIALLLVTLLVPASAFARQAASISNDRIFQAIGVAEGATVCEIGAGDGELSIAAARAVGERGRIYTSELGDARVKSLQEKIAGSKLSQITVVAGDPAKTNFPEAACDALFMRNVYHHFADPPKMNASIAAALKPGGRVAVIDFTPPGKEAECPADRGKDGMHGVLPDTLSRELKDAGFEPIASDAGGQRWFMVVASKPKQ